MSKILPWGALLALSLTACSGSGDSLTEPDVPKPSMDPGSIRGGQHEALPLQTCPPATAASWVSSTGSNGYSVRVELFSSCPRRSQAA